MRLTVLGCSGSGPGPESPASGYLLQADGASVVLDLGNGAFGVLQRHLDPFELDALVLTHLHPDHCADVSALVVYYRFHPTSRLPRPLPVHAPEEAPDRLANAYAPSQAERERTDLSDVLELRALEPGRAVPIAGFTVTAVRVAHPCEAYGLRVEHGGCTLVFTGDSGPCDALPELAGGADTLLAEASWTDHPDRPEGLHLSGHQAGQLAAAAGVGRLLLTHVPPWTDADAVLAEARAAFDGPAELVRAGVCYQV